MLPPVRLDVACAAGLLLLGLLLPLGVPSASAAEPAHPAERYDLIIHGGKIVDGTGAPWYRADLGIRDGKIAAIGRLDPEDADQRIDASGLVVAPGFIDMMGQNATPMLKDPNSAMNLLTQGITTINAGEGGSAAPLSDDEAVEAGWSTMAEYFQLIDLKGLPVNITQTVGHTQIRRLVMGDQDRRPSDDELRAMQDQVRDAMRAGAIGVSTALIYPPAVYAPTRELVALAKVAGEHGGRYYTHMRNEGDLLLEAIDEAIEIGTAASVPVHVFHLKAAGRQNWGKMDLALARIRAARAEGLAIEQPFISFCTDVGPSGGAGSASHPRAFGALPRLLARYVRQLGVLSLEQAIAQASGVAANEVMAFDRGRIAIGLAADIIAFDADRFTDEANFASPHAPATGMHHVVVNGEVVLKGGEFTGKRPGYVLRGPGYDARQAPDRIVTGRSDRRLAAIDEAMQSFLRKHRLPGMALAITHQGRLVHSRGYGYADVAAWQPVQPSSRFRIASISKPFTAAAVLQLVEQGKLSLQDCAAEVLQTDLDGAAEDEDEVDREQPDPRLRAITIEQLLQHRGGWDRDASFDAMFQSVRFADSLGIPPPAMAGDVIRAMRTVPLDFDPGKRYAYSNYGYCLLGRVIEKLSGQTYEQYVQEHVLGPLGIETMCMGGTRLASRHPDEVRYYHPDGGKSVFAEDLGKPVASPYGAWCLEAMDAHGGWIATAEDLVRFAAALDRPASSPILSAESIALISKRPIAPGGKADKESGDVYYGLGWSVREHEDATLTMWHGGSLPGTNTELARRRDGVNFAVLLNTRVSARSSRLIGEATRALHRAIDSVNEWPEHDLFVR